VDKPSSAARNLSSKGGISIASGDVRDSQGPENAKTFVVGTGFRSKRRTWRVMSKTSETAAAGNVGGAGKTSMKDLVARLGRVLRESGCKEEESKNKKRYREPKRGNQVRSADGERKPERHDMGNVLNAPEEDGGVIPAKERLQAVKGGERTGSPGKWGAQTVPERQENRGRRCRWEKAPIKVQNASAEEGGALCSRTRRYPKKNPEQ